MTSFNTRTTFSRQALMVTAAILLLAGADGASAKSSGSSGSHMSGGDTDHNKKPASQTAKPARSTVVTDAKSDRKLKRADGDHAKTKDNYADKKKGTDKNKTAGTTTTTAGQVALPGTHGTNDIHPIVNKATNATTAGSNPPAGSTAGYKSPPVASVGISNGQGTGHIAELSGGLLVTSTGPGTITVSNGKNSLILPGTAIAITGASSVGGGAGVQFYRQPNGSLVAVANPPSAGSNNPPASNTPPASTLHGEKLSQFDGTNATVAKATIGLFGSLALSGASLAVPVYGLGTVADAVGGALKSLF